jgi:hypothetical protein
MVNIRTNTAGSNPLCEACSRIASHSSGVNLIECGSRDCIAAKGRRTWSISVDGSIAVLAVTDDLDLAYELVRAVEEFYRHG